MFTGLADRFFKTNLQRNSTEWPIAETPQTGVIVTSSETSRNVGRLDQLDAMAGPGEDPGIAEDAAAECDQENKPK